MIQIFQNKELTLIGPPASLGQRTEREFYLGSAAYYIGIAGLVITRFRVWGAAIPNGIIFWVSIPFFYNLLRDVFGLRKPWVGTLLYVMSPLSVIHARFYWNPNAIIGLSTLFWYLALDRDRAWWKMVLAGLSAGLIFNLHYVALLPIVLWLVWVAFGRQFKQLMLIKSGLLVGMLPVFLFEVRNKFFLTNTFWYNWQHRQPGVVSLATLIENLSRFPLAIVGVRPAEIGFFPLIDDQLFQQTMGLVVIILMLGVGVKMRKEKRGLWLICLISFGLVSVLSGKEFMARYLFGIFPLVVWLVAEIVQRTKYILVLPILILMIVVNWRTLAFRPDPGKNYVGIDILEEASRLIAIDNPQGKYNLSENIYGDAQARGLRYFVIRDVVNKPENEVTYGWLKTLYVLTPSLEKTEKDHRFEFYAPDLKKVAWEKDLGKVKLIKFVGE